MDIIFENIRFYSKYLALGAAIIGTLNYSAIKHTKARYFLFSVWYIVFTEFLASNFHSWFGESSYIVYNIYTLVQFTFYLWWFRMLLTVKKRKKIVLGFIFVFVTFYIINALILQDIFNEILTYSYVLCVIFTVTSICYYLIEVFNSEEVLRIRQSMYFWFSVGILLFHATFMPFLFANKFLLIGSSVLLRTVQFFLALLMYVFFAIGFIKAKQNANKRKLI